MSDLETGLRALIVSTVRDEVRRALTDALRSDEYLSTAAAAEVAAVTAPTIRRWVEKGWLTRHSAGREIRVRRTELERLLRDGEPRNDGPTHEELVAKLIG